MIICWNSSNFKSVSMSYCFPSQFLPPPFTTVQHSNLLDQIVLSCSCRFYIWCFPLRADNAQGLPPVQGMQRKNRRTRPLVDTSTLLRFVGSEDRCDTDQYWGSRGDGSVGVLHSYNWQSTSLSYPILSHYTFFVCLLLFSFLSFSFLFFPALIVIYSIP